MHFQNSGEAFCAYNTKAQVHHPLNRKQVKSCVSVQCLCACTDGCLQWRVLVSEVESRCEHAGVLGREGVQPQ